MKWNAHELETRDVLIRHFTHSLERELAKINNAFRFMQIESPILLPFRIAPDNTQTIQIQLQNEDLALRQNMVTGAYEASRDILNGRVGSRQKLPIVIWQHGAIFEHEGGKTNEVYRLEYQVLYSRTTAMAYEPVIKQALVKMVHKQCGRIHEEQKLNDFHILTEQNERLATMHERDDFWSGKNIEIIFDLEKCTQASIQAEQCGHRERV